MNAGVHIPILAALFGLAEFAPDWPWRAYAQAALILVGLATAPARTERVPLVPSLFLAGVFAAAAGMTRSIGWGLLALVAVAAARTRRPALPFFSLAAAGTLGAGCLYLHTAAIWDVDLSALGAQLAGVLPTVSRLQEWVVVNGEKVHQSAFSPLSALPAAAAVLAWRGLRGVRLLGFVLLAALLAAGVRAGLVILWASLHQPLWGLDPLAIGLYVALVGAAIGYLAPEQPSRPRTSGREVALSLFAGAALAASALPDPAPASRPLKIVIDDAHGEWETTQRPYDTKRYGRDTVYTYALLREWLSNRHAVEVQTQPPIQPRGDILLIKTPALAYSQEEKAAVLAFVRQGGGVLVFGDHTNLFGTTDHINGILEPLAIALRTDAAIPRAGITRKLRAEWWNAGPLVPAGAAWESQTSATIAARLGRGRQLLVDTGVLAEAAEFSNERNFGNLRPSLDDRQPPLVVAAVATQGSGRVVVIADSTPWSNFAFFAPGNKEFLDAALRLAATPTNRFRRPAAALLALCALAAAVAVGAPLRVFGFLCATYAVLAALTCVRGPTTVTPARYGANERRLVVDACFGAPDWDTDIRVGKPAERDVYSAFLAWASRFGAHPEVVEHDAYRDIRRPVLVLNPSRTPGAGHLAAAEAFVREGGRILVLDDPARRPQSTARALLDAFGVRYRSEVTESSLHAAAGPQLPDVVWALPLALLQETRQQPGLVLAERTGLDVALEGVDPVWVDAHGLVVYGRKAVGKGSLNVFIRSSAFSQLVMGDVWGGIEPGREKEQLYELEYALLNDLFPPPPRQAAPFGEDLLP